VSSDYLLGRPYSVKARSFQKSGGRCWAPLTRWRASELETDPLLAVPASLAQVGAALHDFLMVRHSPDAVAMAWREHFVLADSAR
jgi:hypothetical protein